MYKLFDNRVYRQYNDDVFIYRIGLIYLLCSQDISDIYLISKNFDNSICRQYHGGLLSIQDIFVIYLIYITQTYRN